MENLPRWGYDKESHMCVQFVFGGCGGNFNNFLTLSDCRQTCYGCPILACQWCPLGYKLDDDRCETCTCLGKI